MFEKKKDESVLSLREWVIQESKFQSIRNSMDRVRATPESQCIETVVEPISIGIEFQNVICAMVNS